MICKAIKGTIATIADSSTWETAFASKACNINSAFGLTTYILVL